MTDLYPRHSSIAAAVNYRKVRQLSFDFLNQSQISDPTKEDIKEEEHEDVFDSAYRQVFTQDITKRQEVISNVCHDNMKELEWGQDDLFQHVRHKNVWDVIHNIVFCPIAKVFSKQNINNSFIIIHFI